MVNSHAFQGRPDTNCGRASLGLGLFRMDFLVFGVSFFFNFLALFGICFPATLLGAVFFALYFHLVAINAQYFAVIGLELANKVIG
jgi:hypothetical protein